MIAVLLTILKTIGIVLLWIIAIAVILLALILFVPVRYKACGEWHESYKINACVSWLFHLVHFGVHFDGSGLTYKLRIAGIPVFSDQGSGRKHSRKHVRPHRKRQSSENAGFSQDDPLLQERAEEEKYDFEDDLQKYDEDTEDTEDTENPGSTDQAAIQDRQKGKARNRLMDFLHRIRSFMKQLPEKLRHFGESVKHAGAKLKHLWRQKEKWEDFFASETFHRALESAKKYILILLKRIRPRKIEITAHYGFEDPSSTGKVYGILSIVRTYLPGKYSITPDFSEKCLEGDFLLAGRIIMIQIIPPVWHLYRDKNIRRCYHKFRK